MEELKVAKKHFSKLGFLMLLCTVVLNGVQYGAVCLGRAIAPTVMKDINIAIIVQTVPMYVFAMPFIMWLMCKVCDGKTPEKHSMTKGQYIASIPMAYAIVVITNLVGTMITLIIGAVKGSAVQNQLMTLSSNLNIYVATFFMAICAPIMEELLFRKTLVSRILPYGEKKAIFLSALAFALFHGNLNQFVYAFTLGLFFGFLYVKTGNIKITISLHMFINFFSGVLSTKIMGLVDMTKYQEIAASGDMVALMEFVGANAIGFILLLLFVVFIYGNVFVGAILLIVNRKRFRCSQECDIVIPKEKTFQTIALNIGVVLFLVYWVAAIICQLLDIPFI